MHTFVSILLLTSLPVFAGEFVDKAVGLKMNVPDGWKRDEAREKGSIKFSGSYNVSGKGYVSLVVEAVPTSEFSADDWLDSEKEVKGSHYIGEVTTKFTPDQDTRVGGLDAVGYVFGGKAKDGEGSVRFRVYGVVHGNIFFQITEYSFNGAHKQAADKLKEIWGGIMFQEAEGGGDEGDGGNEDGKPGVKPVEGKPTAVEDKLGNYKTTLPPGWGVEVEAPVDEGIRRRMRFVRMVGDFQVAWIDVWRWPLQNAALFNTGTPDEILQDFNKQVKLFETYYGQGSHELVHPQMDEGVGFGGASKAGEYELRSITTSEMADIAAAEKKVRKGIKDVKVPEFKEKVVRGRLAMVSPNVYFTRAWIGPRSLNDDPQLVAEINKIHEDFELLTTKAKPPPLVIMGKKVGNTLTDEAFAKERKDKGAVQVQGRKTYRVEYTFKVPVGWDVKTSGIGGDAAFLAYAQDGNNSWVRVSVAALSHKKAGEERGQYDKSTTLNTWKSNWSSKARGAKIPSKPQKFALGKVRGEGYKLLKGRVNGFRGTFTCILSDKFPGKGWRTLVEVETRGDGHKVFADALKKFVKSFKAKNIKVK